MTHAETTRRRLETLEKTRIEDWTDIDRALDALRADPADPPNPSPAAAAAQGLAFVTYDYGIDGVSIEITKYARCLDRLLHAREGRSTIHLIGGEFTHRADTVLDSAWHRCTVDDFNGWSKWSGGTWFAKLFYEDMPAGSEVSRALAREVWTQAVTFARAIADYLEEHGIGLILPVNVNSNPGNLASSLAVVLASEATGVYVLNSNHDFFWEGGTPAAEREPGAEPGVRDHFFRNEDNATFFRVFERILPWNGRRWIQFNINSRQSDTLVERYGFDRTRVFEVGTAIDDAFFAPCPPERKTLVRRRMTHIVSDGEPRARTVAIDDHLSLRALGDWMASQRPLVCGARAGLAVDLAAPGTVILLQPTRIIARKRIERDWELIGALLNHPAFRDPFTADPNRALVLHITGPAPIEHRADLETVLGAYRTVLRSLPAELADRVFQSFSVGTEDHPSLQANGLGRLYIHDIYHLADLVVFPSETEGRGLPIVESGASGIPIVCSRYEPRAVFAEVVGEHLPPEGRIEYTLFPEGDFPPALLDEVADMILHPDRFAARHAHNRAAIESRYGMEALQSSFNTFIDAVS